MSDFPQVIPTPPIAYAARRGAVQLTMKGSLHMRTILSLSIAVLCAGCSVGSGRILEAPGFGGERSLCLEGMDVLYGMDWRADYRFWNVTCAFYFAPSDPGRVKVLFAYQGEDWDVRYPGIRELKLTIDGETLVVPAEHAYRRCSRWVWEYVWGAIPLEAVERMARAGTIRGALGSDEFDFTGPQRERIAQYADCIRRRGTNEVARAETLAPPPAR